MKIKLVFFLTLLAASSGFQNLSAQNIDVDKLKNLKTRNIGPAGMSGRITCIDVVPNHEEQIFIGTASGGVWKSTNAGTSWKPIFDKESTQSVGALAIQKNNADVIWVGTGEGNPRNSMNSGNGIYKSIDGGNTWKHMGLRGTRNIHRIIIDRDNPNTVYIAAMGSAWGESEHRGLYKTTDGGKTWAKILYNNNLTGCADLIVSAKNPNKLIAAMYEHKRQAWTFNSGGKGSGLYISYDAGLTWAKKNGKKGLPKGDYGRIGLAAATNKTDILYALVESKKTGLYRSDNGGESWTLQATKNIGNRPFYYADIFVDPNNENRIFNLWSFMTMSEDGGKTFKTVMPYSKYHPDHHAFWINPNNSLHIIDGNDGGMNISHDGGKSWRFVQNLPLAQFYHIAVDNEIPYNIYGGMQDNGSWKGPAYVWQAGGIRNTHWQELVFGDGFDVVPMLNDHTKGFAMYQGGNLYSYNTLTGKKRYIKPVHPDGVKLRFNWNAAIEYNQKKNILYYGSQFVHKSINGGMSWEIISPDLTTNDPEKQKQIESGGLTIDATQAENFTTITCIAADPEDEQTIWVGTDDGNLQITRDGGKNWTNLSSKLKGLPENAWIPQIKLSKINRGEAFVVVNNYRANNWEPYLYMTTNYGKSWKRLADENTLKSYVRCVLQDPNNENLLFMGTDRGLYISIDKGDNWTHWTNDLPNCPISDLAFQQRENDLIIGTFGRAAWIMDDIKPLQELAKGNEYTYDSLKIFGFNSAYNVSYKSPYGVRFTADAVYMGKNKRSAAQSFLWVNPELIGENIKPKKVGEEINPPSPPLKRGSKLEIKTEVFDKNHHKIRTFAHKYKKAGLIKTHWNMKADGSRYAHENALKDKEILPTGNTVLPGKYLIKISYKNNADSAWVHVLPDPRVPFDKLIARANITNYNNLQTWIDSSYQDYKKMLKMEKFISLSLGVLSGNKDSVSKQIIKDAKVLKDSIKTLKNLYRIPASFKGYDHVTERINNKLYKAQSMILGNNIAGSTNYMFAVNDARKSIIKASTGVNGLQKTLYKIYKTAALKMMNETLEK